MNWFLFIAGFVAGVGVSAVVAGVALFLCVAVDGLNGIDPNHPKR